jgi:hypothetical protein
MITSPPVHKVKEIYPSDNSKPMEDPISRPRTPNAAPLEVDKFVAVFSEMSARGAVRAAPTNVPTISEVMAAHQPSPKETGSQPKTITPKDKLDPTSIDIISRGKLVRSVSGIMLTP